MAGIDAGTNSNNCCSGTFDDRDKCLQTGVYKYSYFKDGCSHACTYTAMSRETIILIIWLHRRLPCERRHIFALRPTLTLISV